MGGRDRRSPGASRLDRDLIGMKRTASRPKDHIVADELVVIAELRRKEQEAEKGGD